MSDTAAVKKQLKIKSGVVQRLAKEAKLYQKERDELIVKKDKLVAEKAEDWDIKNATKMVDESGKMILDAKSRLAKALEELEALIKSTTLPSTDENFINAQKALNEAVV